MLELATPVGWRRLVAVATVAWALHLGGVGAASAAEHEPAQLGVVGFYTPRLMVLRYQPLADYLTQTTSRRWELAVGTGYQGTVDRLCAGELDLAYLGPFAYLRAQDQCGAEPVVHLRTGQRDEYRSVILVREDSDIESLADLRGRRVGLGPILSTSSHLVPLSMLRETGFSAAAGEGSSCQAYDHHEQAALGVLLGEVDACGVRDIVGERFAQRGLRVVAESGPIPNFPLVISPHAPESLRDELLAALVTRPATDPEAASAIAALDPELAGGFAPSNDSEFDELRLLVTEVFGEDALVVDEDELRRRSGCGLP